MTQNNGPVLESDMLTSPLQKWPTFFLFQKLRNVVKYMQKNFRFYFSNRLTKFSFKLLRHRDFCEPDSETITSDSVIPDNR